MANAEEAAAEDRGEHRSLEEITADLDRIEREYERLTGYPLREARRKGGRAARSARPEAPQPPV